MVLQNGARAERSQINQHSVCPSLPAVWPEACHPNHDYHIENVWNRSGRIAWRPAGLPPEELLFGFGFGLYWSTVYKHFTWRQSDTLGQRVANANRKLGMTKTSYRGSDSPEGGLRE